MILECAKCGNFLANVNSTDETTTFKVNRCKVCICLIYTLLIEELEEQKFKAINNWLPNYSKVVCRTIYDCGDYYNITMVDHTAYVIPKRHVDLPASRKIQGKLIPIKTWFIYDLNLVDFIEDQADNFVDDNTE